MAFEDEQSTYGQLNERASQLARHLQGVGVGPGTLVGICVERSLEMVVGPRPGPVPIGWLIDNMQAYILDTQCRRASIGAPGELHVGGIGLARRYHNRPELTAEKFIADPFSREPGERLYKTGDLALPDGAIEYLVPRGLAWTKPGV